MTEAQVLRTGVLPEMEAALEATRYAYERGRYSYLEWVDAQRELVDVQRTLIDASANAHLYRAEIERLDRRVVAGRRRRPPMKQVCELLLIGCAVGGCGSPATESRGAEDAEHEAADARGPHGGRVLEDGGFSIELAMFEAGVPPELHAWAFEGGRPVSPAEVDLTVDLTRLGGEPEQVRFVPVGDYLARQPDGSRAAFLRRPRGGSPFRPGIRVEL